MLKSYIASEWQDALQRQNLHSFDDIWNYEENANIEKDWVEEPNQRRGGWSGVCRIVLSDPKGAPKIVFLKRQFKHMYRSIWAPFKGCPTFRREIYNIMRFKRRDLPTVTPIYYAQQGNRAILMTEDLTGYRSLYDWDLEWQEKGLPQRALRNRIISETGRVIGKMHQYHYRHFCPEFKHIFLSLENNDVKVSLIDLEKTRYWWWLGQCRRLDLRRLLRVSARKISNTDRWCFMKAYFGENADLKKVKSLWRGIVAFDLKKRKRSR